MTYPPLKPISTARRIATLVNQTEDTHLPILSRRPHLTTRPETGVSGKKAEGVPQRKERTSDGPNQQVFIHVMYKMCIFKEQVRRVIISSTVNSIGSLLSETLCDHVGECLGHDC